MRIKRIRCYHYNKAFTVPFDSLQIRRRHADSIILRIDFENGISGFGESAPRYYVTGEDVESVTKIIAQSFSRIAGITHYQSALAAIDIGIVDALEKANCPELAALFPVSHHGPLRFSASLPILPLRLIEKYFPLLQSHVDISVAKILINRNADDNFERVKLIRQLAGPTTELRLEFNGQMQFSEVVGNVEKLLPFNISALEEPLPPQNIQELKKIRSEFGLNLVADESMVSLTHAESLLKDDTYNIFNIKISKCGGMLRSKQIADFAMEHGIKCQVGTHVGESKILTIAGERFARSLKNFDCYGGGSEILFSRIFEKGGTEPDVLKHPHTFQRGVLNDEELVNLTSNFPLLMDLKAGD